MAEDAAAAYLAAVTVSIRRSLYRRLRGQGLTQDQLTGVVAGATRSVVDRSGVADLVQVAAASGDLRGALGDLDPDDPAAARFDNLRDRLGDPVRALLDPPA